MEKIRVLFLCRHNSGRSQMAEAFMNKLADYKVYAESAGLEPEELNPLVIKVMKEIDFDMSAKQANSVFEYFKEGRLYNYVITLCDNSGFEQCPVFPGVTQRLHWPYPDPKKLTGTSDEKLAALRKIRDQIREQVKEWVKKIS